MARRSGTRTSEVPVERMKRIRPGAGETAREARIPGLGAGAAGNHPLMTRRVLPEQPVLELADYQRAGGGRGIEAARRLGPDGVIEHLLAAGLRGRGGAGFPTGKKWAAVRTYASSELPAAVVVNAAEGEPGSFKDRAIVRANPFAVLEGALIAASAVGADRVVVASKRSFTTEMDVIGRTIAAVTAAGWNDGRGWNDGVELIAFAGPGEYLYGEETALLEAIDGRPPFPRVAPPYRHGVEEISDDRRGEPSRVVEAAPDDETGAPPTLVSNVETMANVPGILAEGPAWFRSEGTDESPGTIVCTVTGATRRPGIGEVPMGTPLRQVIDEIGGGPRPGRRISGAMSGVANAVVPEALLDTPLTYEAMQAIGSGLGAAGFIVFDDETDFAAVAHGVSRFLAVESCGQCMPCKQDGLALAGLLDRIRRSDANDLDLLAVDDHLRTVADSARCFLAYQHQRVVGSIASGYADALRAHAEGKVPAATEVLIAPIRELADGTVSFDESQAAKQPDWSFDPVDSGKVPADRLTAGDEGTVSAAAGFSAPEPPPARASASASAPREEPDPQTPPRRPAPGAG